MKRTEFIAERKKLDAMATPTDTHACLHCDRDVIDVITRWANPHQFIRFDAGEAGEIHECTKPPAYKNAIYAG